MNKIVKLSNPIQLFLSALTYTLGAGIAHYLGKSIHTASFLLGLIAILSLIGAAPLLSEYFRLPIVPLEKGELSLTREKYRIMLLQVSYAALAFSSVVILTMVLTQILDLSAGIIYILAFLFLMAYSLPPVRVSETGYGELVMAVTLGTLVPALAFLLQYGQVHRLLSFVTFPLTLLTVAYLLIYNFPTFATDQKLSRHTLLTRLTWQRAIPIHHLLIFAAFLLFAAAPILEIPWVLVWPVFLGLPFAAIQIIWLQHIANGGRTLWSFLTTLASATVGLTAYLLALTFWIR